MTKAQSFEKTLFYLALTFFLTGSLLRAVFVDFSDFDYGVYSDHFINAVSAKNISIGLGWSSSGYETYLFNPENLTVGPTIVLPVSIAIALFGNKLSVPGITVLILNLFFLLLVFRSLKKLHIHHISFYPCVFLLVFLFTFFKSYYWHRMIGEVAATLLLLLVIIYLSHYLQTFDKQTLFAASIAGFFAMGTKELVLIPIVTLTCIIIAMSFASRKNPDHTWLFWLGRPLLFLSACLLLPVFFSLYRNALLQTQADAWRSAYYVYANGIYDYYSGINTLREYLSLPENALSIFRRVLTNTLWNGGTFLHLSFVGMRGLQYWLCVFGAAAAYFIVSRKFATLYTLLALSATPLLLWFFCISEKAMPRHLYIGLCLAILACLFYICSIRNSPLRYALASLALLLIVLTGDQSSRYASISLPLKMPANLAAINDMQLFIKQQASKSFAWIGMVDNNEFEYLATGPNNFINGFDLIADSIVLNESAYLATHPQLSALIAARQYHSAFDFYVSPENTRPETVAVNFIKPLEFNWLHFKSDVARYHRVSDPLTNGELCNRIVYQNQYYLVEHCTSEDIQAFFEKQGGLPTRPRKWRPYILLPSERIELF